jgi:hypothetical protein
MLRNQTFANPFLVAVGPELFITETGMLDVDAMLRLRRLLNYTGQTILLSYAGVEETEMFKKQKIIPAASVQAFLNQIEAFGSLNSIMFKFPLMNIHAAEVKNIIRSFDIIYSPELMSHFGEQANDFKGAKELFIRTLENVTNTGQPLSFQSFKQTSDQQLWQTQS